MIEFEIHCRRCRTLITLLVRDQQTREFFEKHGALCEACDGAGRQPAPASGG